MSIAITPSYHSARIEELRLVADFLEQQAREKEAERERREQMKEEEKAQKEFEAEKTRLEKELNHQENALEKAVESGNAEAIEAARANIDALTSAIQGVESRAANTSMGYVYVISNIGSFGEGVVKIGLTRRLDPDLRIHELSNASVPFIFDKHAAILVDDAVSLEHSLHKAFENLRINKANPRKEFFRVSPKEAVAKLEELSGKEVFEFSEVAEAIEWRQTQNSTSQLTISNEEED
jgi:hypothetical protein